MSARHEATFSVPPDHPCLPGHFPGRPVVPGVLLLDAVIAAARNAFGLGPATGLPRSKFAAPVLAGEAVRMVLTLSEGGRLAFTCHVGDRVVASGEARFPA
jgi:3-hydroxyacyl-[acyl-carrier-protein] dehydratase